MSRENERRLNKPTGALTPSFDNVIDFVFYPSQPFLELVLG
ncbi:hypothetical protein [[Leptolyngbya] sp. PCC 7376]|nr:hypothetical protein [[Leptolyngbya] sp. PCC 7376]